MHAGNCVELPSDHNSCGPDHRLHLRCAQPAIIHTSSDHLRIHKHCALRAWSKRNVTNTGAVHDGLRSDFWVCACFGKFRHVLTVLLASSWPSVPPFAQIARPLPPRPSAGSTADPWSYRGSIKPCALLERRRTRQCSRERHDNLRCTEVCTTL